MTIDCLSDEKWRNFPRIEGGVTLCWETGYYDGIISGFGLYQEKLVFITLIAELDKETHEDWPKYRVFGLFSLTEEEIFQAMGEHAIYQAHIGFDCNRFPVNFSQNKNKYRHGYEKESSKAWLLYRAHLARWQTVNGIFDIEKFDSGSVEPIGWIYEEELYKI